MMICVVKGCKDNFPLRIEATNIQQTDDFQSERFSVEFAQSLLGKVEYGALFSTLSSVNDLIRVDFNIS
jgi:hypothetical protein